GGRVIAREPAGPVLVFDPNRASSVIASYGYKPNQALAAVTDGRTLGVLEKGVPVGVRLQTVLDVIPLPRSPGNRTIRPLPESASYGPDRPLSCNDEGSRCAAAELRLTDVDGNIAVYVHGNAVNLLDVVSGKTVTVARPALRPVNAQLEPEGLY